ncbi:hypothetical protein CMV_015768 [Castanea mollissima]|uniref:DUF4283 domain-containing protein n=1 Tax=Castanea mollissima TaxID=60419 RepID=A0A8J4QV24_9ROSI|nr:hypothetical protein CMV_015768 [Castanea mollissima]
MADRHYYVHHPEKTDDGKNKKPMTSSSDESESALKLNLRACQQGDDHDMDANKFSTTIEVEINPTELAPITDQFGYSFIIYVHGRKISYHNLYTRLVRLLYPYGPYQLVDLGLGFFLLKISEYSGYIMVLSKYPLSIPNYCVTLLPWKPNFRPSETMITQVDVWVQLPELPIEYYGFLFRIAAAIGGNLLKIDPITEGRKMCKFARFCVRVDLTRPLPGHIKIGEIWQRVEYEGLDMVCSLCRHYGHLKHNCLDQLLTSATINASRGQASTSNELVNSAGHRRLADHTSKIVMSKSADSSSSDDNSPWTQARHFKQHQGESSGSQRPHVQNQNKATETESDLEMSDQSKPKASVIAESSTELMQRKNPLTREGTSLSPITEGTLIQPPKDKPPHIPKSLKSEKGLPSESSIAGSSNSFPQDSSQHLCHQPAQTMVKKAYHTIPTQPHGNQPQTLSSSETASPRPSPMVKPCIQLYYTGIHKAMVKKEIGNTPITEFSTEIRQTLYSIKSEVASLDIGVSKTAMRNQHAISFLPTVSDFTKKPLQNQQEAIYQTCAETVPQTPLQKLLCWKYNGTDNITLIQTMKYLKQHENPSIVLLFGIKSSGNDADQAIEEIGFSGSYLIDPFLFDDGVWLLWKKDVVIEVNSSTSHLIYATVHFLPHPSNRMLCGTGKSSEANAPYAR